MRRKTLPRCDFLGQQPTRGVWASVADVEMLRYQKQTCKPFFLSFFTSCWCGDPPQMEAKDQQQPRLGVKFVSMIGHSLQGVICVMVFVLMQRFPIYARSRYLIPWWKTTWYIYLWNQWKIFIYILMSFLQIWSWTLKRKHFFVWYVLLLLHVSTWTVKRAILVEGWSESAFEVRVGSRFPSLQAKVFGDDIRANVLKDDIIDSIGTKGVQGGWYHHDRGLNCIAIKDCTNW